MRKKKNPRIWIGSINMLLEGSFVNYQRHFCHIYHYYIQKYNQIQLTVKQENKNSGIYSSLRNLISSFLSNS